MSFELRIEPTGQTVAVAEGQTLLDACLRAGVWLPHACCHGLCATCKVRVLCGEVEHGEASPFALMDFERDEGLALACCATLQSDATLEADLDEDPDARVIPVQDFAGTVLAVQRLTPTIVGIRLRLDGVLDFQAGQYINLAIPGVEGRRAFSIASTPLQAREQHEIELQVRRVPGGAGTTWLHEQLQPGMTLNLAGPYGRFFVRRSAARPLLFIAGGSGLSSPLSMVRELLATGAAEPITLVVGQRCREELYAHDELLALAEAHPGLLRYLPVLSHEPEGSAWPGLRGWAHEAARDFFAGDFRGLKAYLCGPPALIEASVATLMQGRLFERDIHTEQFLSAADAQRARSPVFRSV
ncbi:NADH:ubiquinone reductase (Na(+)-transporting) subunit F [Ideonella livida]|uniref:2Fe-2S iron-sulfur cluster binding domain-containing protein n=1 Tax=Ideonella livida TaxID=2707176 RepID=A0A7C9PKX0_9BURK|nr:2Fe-2S iron-sulfur cluster binding domain-containing protein [Ideonella livida]NDY93754.1 2Fe-2S iron-sulfur cluster binding domain-containing protein [Ideonella livida]